MAKKHNLPWWRMWPIERRQIQRALLGTFGAMGCFSISAYKFITSGEGGLVVTNDPMLYDRARMQHDCAARFGKG